MSSIIWSTSTRKFTMLFFLAFFLPLSNPPRVPEHKLMQPPGVLFTWVPHPPASMFGKSQETGEGAGRSTNNCLIGLQNRKLNHSYWESSILTFNFQCQMEHKSEKPPTASIVQPILTWPSWCCSNLILFRCLLYVLEGLIKNVSHLNKDNFWTFFF